MRIGRERARLIRGVLEIDLVRTMPTSTGLGAGTTEDAVCIACLPIGDLAADELYEASIQRHVHLIRSNDTSVNSFQNGVAATSLGAGSKFWWDLVAGVHFPANARALYVHFATTWGGSGSFTGPQVSASADGGTSLLSTQRLRRLTANANNWEDSARVPIVSDSYPSVTPDALRIQVDYGGSLTTPASAVMTIMGWDF